MTEVSSLLAALHTTLHLCLARRVCGRRTHALFHHHFALRHGTCAPPLFRCRCGSQHTHNTPSQLHSACALRVVSYWRRTRLPLLPHAAPSRCAVVDPKRLAPKAHRRHPTGIMSCTTATQPTNVVLVTHVGSEHTDSHARSRPRVWVSYAASHCAVLPTHHWHTTFAQLDAYFFLSELTCVCVVKVKCTWTRQSSGRDGEKERVCMCARACSCVRAGGRLLCFYAPVNGLGCCPLVVLSTLIWEEHS